MENYKEYPVIPAPLRDGREVESAILARMTLDEKEYIAVSPVMYSIMTDDVLIYRLTDHGDGTADVDFIDDEDELNRVAEAFYHASDEE